MIEGDTLNKKTKNNKTRLDKSRKISLQSVYNLQIMYNVPLAKNGRIQTADIKPQFQL